jgi:polysaccharide biosynthesis transport protein
MNRTHLRSRLDEVLPAWTARDFLTPLFRHKGVVISVFTIVFALSIYAAWAVVSKYYVASMQIVVQQHRSDPAITAGQTGAVMNTNRGISPDQISSEMAILRGDDMLRSVVETCGMVDSDHNFSLSELFFPRDPERRKAAKIEKAVTSLGKGLKVEAAKVSDVIDVRFGVVGNPETPACALQNLGKLYLQKRLQLQRPPGSSNFFAEQTDKYGKELTDVEERLAQFSHDEGVAAPDVLRTDLAQQLSVSMASLYTTQQAMAADEDRLRDLQKQMGTTPERITTQQISNSAMTLLQQLEASLLTAQVKRRELLTKYDPSYPLVVQTDEEIATTQKAIEKAKSLNYMNETTDHNPTFEFLHQDYARTQADLASQKATASATKASIKRMQDQLVALDAQSLKQGALIREEKANEANYLLYLNKREQERAADALDARRIADVSIAVPAVPPALPAINPLLAGLGGFVLAVLAAIAAGFITERIDPSFRTPVEVSETLRIPVLASLPRQAA